MTAPLVNLIQSMLGGKTRFGTVFEWCAGPGFIGFALLTEGLCDFLCVADVNPHAIECVNKTVTLNKLEGRVHAYVSDNMESVPEDERFDLVVGNPPSFCAVNPAHPASRQLNGDIRGNDSDWRIHRGFYSQIATFLNPNALLFVLEVNLYDREVFTLDCAVPLDVRPEEPRLTFLKMIQKGGLTHVEDVVFHPDPASWAPATGFKFWVQISQKSVPATA
jgi:methylase of polypeptide subunit release factors